MFSQTAIATDFLLFVECFIIYSMIGWLVESVYMSFCNHKLTNRGFAKGPFCPIYGCGGAIGFILLHSLAEHVIMLYIVGALLATCFEFLVGELMKRFLHQVWWDYNDKPFNYKGIICLESTIAWGFYAVIIVRYLNAVVVTMAQMLPRRLGMAVCFFALTIYFIDFFYHLLAAFDMTPAECKERIAENVREFRTRW
jgi:uncharacterized membrane protein